MTVIKRYSNRKLYDTEAGRYVTLDEIGERIHRGEEFSVIDHTTGADLTAVTMMQVVFEREKKLGGMLPKAILTSLIQTGNTAINSLRTGLASYRDPAQQVEQEISHRLKVLLADGILAAEEFQRMTELLLSPRWHQPPATAPSNASAPAGPEAGEEDVDSLLRQVDKLEKQIEEIKARNQQS